MGGQRFEDAHLRIADIHAASIVGGGFHRQVLVMFRPARTVSMAAKQARSRAGAKVSSGGMVVWQTSIT